MTFLHNFWQDEQGQDWPLTNSQLAAANSTAS
jgi:hypothetical protein